VEVVGEGYGVDGRTKAGGARGGESLKKSRHHLFTGHTEKCKGGRANGDVLSPRVWPTERRRAETDDERC
jgi:hypothetical protein